ncbi:unnamed protein product [Victoria cruziana]
MKWFSASSSCLRSFSLLFTVSVLWCCTGIGECRKQEIDFSPENQTRYTDLFPHLKFNQGFYESWGVSHIRHSNDGSFVELTLDRQSGSGFASQDKYYHGFFSAAVKLPSSYSAGIVVAFYMSNADAYPHSHDEIDFEFLGHVKRKEWVLQTNIYGNGSVAQGKEERFHLWFDPSQQFHQYSILWNDHHIVFFVDNIAIREVNHSQGIGGAYAAKPMSVCSTIWDGSKWATNGGRDGVNYRYAPFVASFTGLELVGCVGNQSQSAACSGGSGIDPINGGDFVRLSDQQRMGMEWVRKKYMFYSYCQDPNRFTVMPPECKYQREVGFLEDGVDDSWMNDITLMPPLPKHGSSKKGH